MAAHQAPLSLGFSRQEFWSGLPFPSPDSNYSIILFLEFSLYFIVAISQVFILTQRDGKITEINCAILAILVSKMQPVVNIE